MRPALEARAARMAEDWVDMTRSHGAPMRQLTQAIGEALAASPTGEITADDVDTICTPIVERAQRAAVERAAYLVRVAEEYRLRAGNGAVK